MQLVSRGLWIYMLLAVHRGASESSASLPPPELEIRSRSGDSVDLVCRAPEGHRGLVFMLYRFREKVDSVTLQSDAQEVVFTVGTQERTEPELFCCLYKNQHGLYSVFSPYLQMEQQGAAPTGSTPPYPPPVLSVEPSDGWVKHGGTLSFTCSLPDLLQQPRSTRHTPVSFLLLRTSTSTGSLQPIRASHPESGVFHLGPVRGGEDGQYTCLYQVAGQMTPVNSTVSNTVQVSVQGELPVPVLTLQQQSPVWRLLCTGSPAYPGAVFSLYMVAQKHPVASRHAAAIKHQTTFSVPVLDAPVATYQCQYSVLLAGRWSVSDRSLPLAVSREVYPPSAQGLPAVDWPLVLGSISAVVLFLCSVVVVAVVAHRKVKSAAEEKKKRQETAFWTQVHSQDHIVDLPVRQSSFTQEWDSEDKTPVPSPPFWNSLSTFTTPNY